MSRKRFILEMGAGVDLHGKDYTKAAVRAVDDALRHSSLAFIKSMNIDKNRIEVDVTVGSGAPDAVDLEAVKGRFPIGKVTVSSVAGGLDVPDDDSDDQASIVSAAVEVYLRD